MNHFAQLVQLTERLGTNHEYAPGSSGNTSIKIENVMWVKASGKTLRDAAKEQIFVPVEIAASRQAFFRGARVPRVAGFWPMPSAETFAHLVIPQRIVIHLHTVNTVAWAVQREPISRLEHRLAGLAWSWIPFARSGHELAVKVKMAYDDNPTLNVLILGNHGLVVAADDFAAAEQLVADVEARLALPARTVASPAREYLKKSLDTPDWEIPECDRLHSLATDPQSFAWMTDCSLYPCQIIYLRRRLGLHRASARIGVEADRHKRRFGIDPAALLSPSRGVIVNSQTDRETREQLVFSAEVLLRIHPDIPLRRLTPDEVMDLQRNGMSYVQEGCVAIA